jgi:hypothetical protein
MKACLMWKSGCAREHKPDDPQYIYNKRGYGYRFEIEQRDEFRFKNKMSKFSRRYRAELAQVRPLFRLNRGRFALKI